MTFVVPFDGSELAKTALVRAREFSEVLEEKVVAVTVIPNGNTEYARNHEWLRHGESFEMEAVVRSLHEQVMTLVPEANFHHIPVDKHAPAGAIATELRQFARDEDASMVFIGSENAGKMVTGVSDVGASVAAEDSYDIVIIRNKAQSKISAIRANSSYKPPKPEFYAPE